MNSDIIFTPLGGGQSVGASCYFLKLGNSNILLDAGTGMVGDYTYGPDYYSLLTSKYMESMSQIDQIFISHAHMDHVGGLLKLLQEAGRAGVYMTETTECLTRYQLYDKSFLGVKEGDEMERLAADYLLNRITKVNFLETLDFGEYKVTFYPAGHLPGAMMMLFEYSNRKILYTGDYSVTDTALTDGCILPEGVNIDTVIMCGLHAKHPWYKKGSGSIEGFAEKLIKRAEAGEAICCHVSQLSKGVEFLKMLNEANRNRIPIYIDDSIQPVLRKLEKLNIRLLEEGNHLSPARCWPHIYLTAKGHRDKVPGYECLNVNFSLHEDFDEMQALIKKINPKNLYLVHCGPEKSPEDETIEQRLRWDTESKTQVVFAKEENFYLL